MVLAVALIAAGKFKLRHLEAYEVEDFSVWSWNWVLLAEVVILEAVLCAPYITGVNRLILLIS